MNPFENIQPGVVYWVTGLAGAGKSTLARALFTSLRSQRAEVVFLDGDILREVYGDSPGHHLAGRRVTAWRHARMAQMLSQQGLDVVIATISMFHEIHRWNRVSMPNYREIYLEVPMSVLRQRDQKALYSRAEAGEVIDVLGVDLKPEYPQSPHLHLVNDGSRSIEDLLQDCLDSLSPGSNNRV